MNMHHPKRLLGILFAVPAALLSLGWTFSAGPVYRDGMAIGVKGRSIVQDQNLGLQDLPASSRRNSVTVPFPTADLSSAGTRDFDNGYVSDRSNPSEFGIIPLNIAPWMVTWNWGYDHVSQLDAASGKAKFIKTTTDTREGTSRKVSTEVTRDQASSAERDSLSEAGVEFRVGQEFIRKGSASLEVAAGLAIFEGLDESFSFMPWEAVIREQRYRTTATGTFKEEYVYNDQFGIFPLMVLAGPPFNPGPRSGSRTNPGPMIPIRPESASVVSADVQTETRRTGSSAWTRYNVVDLDVEVEHQQAWIGFRLDGQFFETLSLFLEPRLFAEILDIEVDRSEVLYQVREGGGAETVARWDESDDDTSVEWGGGFRAGARVDLPGNWFVELSGGGSWLFDEVRRKVGPNEIVLDLDSVDAGAAVGITL